MAEHLTKEAEEKKKRSKAEEEEEAFMNECKADEDEVKEKAQPDALSSR